VLVSKIEEMKARERIDLWMAVDGLLRVNLIFYVDYIQHNANID
jgi:hypothetical protein